MLANQNGPNLSKPCQLDHSFGLDFMSPGEGRAVCFSFRTTGLLTNQGLILGGRDKQKQFQVLMSPYFAVSDAAAVRDRERAFYVFEMHFHFDDEHEFILIIISVFV